MSAAMKVDDWAVTPEKVNEAVRRIVGAADPVRVVLFGSRARGTPGPDSDLDLAVILDSPEESVRKTLPRSVLRGLRMEVTLIVVSEEKFELHRHWPNSVFYYIDREGIVLYDRRDPQPACEDALRTGAAGRVDSRVSAA